MAGGSHSCATSEAGELRALGVQAERSTSAATCVLRGGRGAQKLQESGNPKPVHDRLESLADLLRQAPGLNQHRPSVMQVSPFFTDRMSS